MPSDEEFNAAAYDAARAEYDARLSTLVPRIPTGGDPGCYSEPIKGPPDVSDFGGAAARVSASVDFTLYNASSGATAKVGVKNGMVNGVLPSGMTVGGDPAYEITISGNVHVWLVIDVAGEGAAVPSLITALSIDSGASVPASTVTTAYLALGDASNTSSGGVGSVSIGSGATGIGSQYEFYCSGAFFFWRA